VISVNSALVQLANSLKEADLRNRKLGKVIGKSSRVEPALGGFWKYMVKLILDKLEVCLIIMLCSPIF
jgi:hypothetical protein